MNLRRQDTPSVAAAKASFSTASAYRIESDPRPPSQKQTPRGSRRRDPVATITAGRLTEIGAGLRFAAAPVGGSAAHHRSARRGLRR